LLGFIQYSSGAGRGNTIIPSIPVSHVWLRGQQLDRYSVTADARLILGDSWSDRKAAIRQLGLVDEEVEDVGKDDYAIFRGVHLLESVYHLI
jgi:hypothetical protein